MKNRRNKIFLVMILSIAILFNNIIVVQATDLPSTVDELIEVQSGAVEANEALMQYFLANGTTLDYPDYFGGCYIEDNILHIRLISPADEEKSKLKEALAGYENVIAYEYGVLSRTYIQEYADEVAIKLKNLDFGVTYWYVDSKSSDIVIGIIPDDIDSATAVIKEIRTNSLQKSHPNIVIEEGAYMVATTDDDIVAGGRTDPISIPIG